MIQCDRDEELFMLFMGHGDVFEHGFPQPQVGIPEICTACHFETPPIVNSGATHSIITYSREPFPLPGNVRPVLFASTVAEEAQAVIELKRQHGTWRSLETLWSKSNP